MLKTTQSDKNQDFSMEQVLTAMLTTKFVLSERRLIRLYPIA